MKLVTVKTRIPEDDHQKLLEQAREEDSSIARVLRRIIRQHMNGKKEDS